MREWLGSDSRVMYGVVGRIQRKVIDRRRREWAEAEVCLFLSETATTEISTSLFVGSVRCL